MVEQKQFRISGTGCTLIDYLYSPVSFKDPEFTKYLSKSPGDGGLSPGKLVFKEEFDKFSGENYMQVRDVITKSKKPVGINIGGPSIVSLIHVSQLLKKFPIEVDFYACRGNDQGGEFIEEMLSKTPVKIGNYKIGKQYTPFTDVLSDPDFDNGHGERIFINNIGAAWEMEPENLDDSFFESDIVVFGGTALVPNIHSALGDLLENAKSKRAVTVVNTVYDFLSEKKDPSKPWMLGQSVETYKFIDLLITDMEEALRLSGKSSVDAAMSFFKSVGVGAFIITHGSKDLHFYADSALFGQIPHASLPVSEKVVQELMSEPERKGDTTGCGDNFAGGVIASVASQLLEKQEGPVDLKNAVALGVASGGFACFYNGGTYYEEYPEQKAGLVESYYKSYLSQIKTEKTVK
ncbi:carbohydrate kinase family protein [Sunxiuqinia sp. A32]|uniref:carbohydrate kinase family protein n=1 Tax=Sunxiuqinia sp. A32 TaxID=3461496 RepID=UPI00404669C4